MNFSTRFLIVLGLSFGLFLQSCSDEPSNTDTTSFEEEQLAKSRTAQIASDWYKVYLEIDKDLEDFRPNPTARAMGYIGIAAYEAVLPGMPDYQSASKILPTYNISGTNPYNVFYWRGIVENGAFWEAVLNRTYYRTFNFFLLNMNDEQNAIIDSMYRSTEEALKAELSPIAMDLATARADVIAESIIQYSESDLEGASQVHEVEPVDYVAPFGQGLWRPTPPDYNNACHPYWRQVRLMATPQYGVPVLPHAPYSESTESEFYQQANEVDEAVKNLSHEDRWIAEFWSDDIVGVTFSPPARQLAIANQLVNQEQADLETALRMYFRLGIALNDASVICWGAKYEFNLERPIDYIRRLINPDFSPILRDIEGVEGSNPNFPAYPSGHSSFAGVGATVFDHFFGHVTSFTDRCHEGNTLFLSDPRTYSSFEEMAIENAYSRVPLGVHFRMDCDEGLEIGKKVGEFVFEKSLSK